MRNNPYFAICAAVTFTLLGATRELGAQQTVTGNGFSVFGPAVTETIELPGGATVQRTANRGFIVTPDPDNPLNGANHKCTSTILVAADGSVSSAGYCDGIDSDGDVYWLWARGNQDGGTWAFIGGTGRFEGIDGGGTYSVGDGWPDGSIINTWEGTWTMQ
jgi:hypothetical protein